MDFYERFRKLPDKKQQSFIQASSKIGDPKEIISYIAAMPILNESGKGGSHSDYEIRIDSRFLVICRKNEISIFTIKPLKCFSVSASWSLPTECRYDFCINNKLEFDVPADYAYPLYSRLAALCPYSFSPLPYTQPWKLSCGILSISDGNVIIQSMTLFGKWKVKATIPVRHIKSCCQTYFDDSEVHWDYLILVMHDGTKYRIRTMYMSTSFQLAQILKSMNSDLKYCFPLDLILHDSLTKYMD